MKVKYIGTRRFVSNGSEFIKGQTYNINEKTFELFARLFEAVPEPKSEIQVDEPVEIRIDEPTEKSREPRAKRVPKSE